MKSYIITEFYFSNNVGADRFRLNRTTGFYEASNSSTEIGLADVLTMNLQSFDIVEIQRGIDKKIFRTGTRVVELSDQNLATAVIIVSFKLIKNKMSFVCSNNVVHTLESCKLASDLEAELKTKKEVEEKKKATVKTVKSDFSDLETKIISSFEEPLRIKGILRKRTETLEEFITCFFTTYNNEFPTIFKESLNVQTEPGKRRSIGDLFMICRYYYPKCTLVEILNIVYKVLPKTIKGFRACFCMTIKKKVWYVNPIKANEILNQDHNDEYGNTYKWYLDRL